MLCYSFTGCSAEKIIKRNGRYGRWSLFIPERVPEALAFFRWNGTQQTKKGVEQNLPPHLFFFCAELGILMARVRQTPTTAGRVVRTRKGETNFRASSRVWNYSQLKSRLLRLPPYSPPPGGTAQFIELGLV